MARGNDDENFATYFTCRNCRYGTLTGRGVLLSNGHQRFRRNSLWRLGVLRRRTRAHQTARVCKTCNSSRRGVCINKGLHCGARRYFRSRLYFGIAPPLWRIFCTEIETIAPAVVAFCFGKNLCTHRVGTHSFFGHRHRIMDHLLWLECEHLTTYIANVCGVAFEQCNLVEPFATRNKYVHSTHWCISPLHSVELRSV